MNNHIVIKGHGSERYIEVNGYRIPGVSSVMLDMDAKGVPVVYVEINARLADFDGEGRFVPLLDLMVDAEEKAARDLYERLRWRFDDEPY